MKKLMTTGLITGAIQISLISTAFAETQHHGKPRYWHVDKNLTIIVTPNNKQQKVCFTFELKNYGKGYVGIAFDDKLYPADTLVMWMKNGKAKLWDAQNPGIKNKALPAFPSAISDNDVIFGKPFRPTDNKQNYTNIEGYTKSNGTTILKCCRPYETHDTFDYQFLKNNKHKMTAFYNMDYSWHEQSNYKQADPIISDKNGKLFVTEIRFD